jgi:hypothetical protein
MESEYSPLTSEDEEVHRDVPPTPEYANEEQYWLANPVTEAARDHATAEAEYEQRLAAIGGRAENHWSFSPVSEEESPAPAVTRSGTRYRISQGQEQKQKQEQEQLRSERARSERMKLQLQRE